MLRRSATFLVLPLAASLAVAACARQQDAAEVTVALAETPGAVSSATVLIDYSQASATPVRSGGQPSCAAIVPNVTADFSDDGQGRITMHARAPQGFSAPIDIAVCRMVPDAPDVTGDTIASRLRVSLVAGSDLAGKPLDEQRIAQGGRERTPRVREAAGTQNGGRERRQAAASERMPGGAGAAADEAPAAVPGGGQAPPDERLASAPAAGAAPAARDAAKEATRNLLPQNRAGDDARTGSPGAAPGGDGVGDTGGAGDGDDPGRADANEDSDTDRAARSYAVTVGVTNPVGKLGALQFDIVHHGGSGGFAGAAASARCSASLAGALASFNDRGNGTVSAGLIDLNGFDTPGPVVTCTFKSRDSVSAGDFSIQVTDATDPELQPQRPQMAVLDVRAQ